LLPSPRLEPNSSRTEVRKFSAQISTRTLITVVRILKAVGDTRRVTRILIVLEITMCMRDCRRGMDLRLDLLTTLTHDPLRHVQFGQIRLFGRTLKRMNVRNSNFNALFREPRGLHKVL
jgi:hypothetical protein